jgi:hypothetical protein
MKRGEICFGSARSNDRSLEISKTLPPRLKGENTISPISSTGPNPAPIAKTPSTVIIELSRRTAPIAPLGKSPKQRSLSSKE